MASLAADDGAAGAKEHGDRHNLIADRDGVSIEQQTALSKIQARFRAERERSTHIKRAREG
eukprot:CAMPEP_0182588816 /NCGR_PEP_ID=MMETSP1324-20130603/68109_1 /TAXON_ID=236786 /ORGANISM="Florenciella sp., Strain RCC1587" /LENGTH=60 /DNA_ID=CAMNT_0024805923 /DNA_START=251 /DNA_END=429 /DNA_ORIENTATION=-